MWGERFYRVVFKIYKKTLNAQFGRQGGLMVSALNSGASGPGSCPGRGHSVVFLSKTLYSHSASPHPGVQMGTAELWGERFYRDVFKIYEKPLNIKNCV